MSKIYSSTNRIRFTDISEKYAIPRAFKAKLSQVHSYVIVYVAEHFHNSKKYRQRVVDVLNCLTYCVTQNEIPPFEWVLTDPLATMPEMDMSLVETTLGDLVLRDEAIEWDVAESQEPYDISVLSSSVQKEENTVPVDSSLKKEKVSSPLSSHSASKSSQIKQKGRAKKDKNQFTESPLSVSHTLEAIIPTPKENLYIQSPKYPRFDYSKIWLSANLGNDNLVIYTTLPEIPTKQNEISITTNLDAMTVQELYNLYPNQIIHTRSPKMYERYNGMYYDEDLGCIFPIDHFTKEEVIDNVIRYPHLFKLKKTDSNGSLVNFYSSIEINGELVPISEIWDDLPETQFIPKDPEFAKEYVIRRYLLEEEHGVKHRYKLFGSLDPYLTLFMPKENYAKRGYTDTLGIVKQCVKSRISYKQSRNPILRRVNGTNV